MTICALQNVQFYISFDVLRPPIDKRGISVPLCSWSNAAAKSATEASQCASRRMSYATQSARLVAATSVCLEQTKPARLQGVLMESKPRSKSGPKLEALRNVASARRLIGCVSVRSRAAMLSVLAALSLTNAARADEGGVSFWVPGFFGSLAAVPQQAGFSIMSIYYHDHCLRQRRRRPGARARNRQASRLECRLDAKWERPRHRRPRFRLSELHVCDAGVRRPGQPSEYWPRTATEHQSERQLGWHGDGGPLTVTRQAHRQSERRGERLRRI